MEEPNKLPDAPIARVDWTVLIFSIYLALVAGYFSGDWFGYKRARENAETEIKSSKAHNEHIGWMKGFEEGHDICKNSYSEGLDVGIDIGYIRCEMGLGYGRLVK